MTECTDPRPGEVPLPFDPGQTADDARIVFIGRAVTPWQSRDDCPKNMGQARERNAGAALVLDPPYRPGLRGISVGDVIWVVAWMNHAARNLVILAPRHRTGTAGVFALRAPSRPNPLGLSRATVLAIDSDRGRIELDALDCVNGTPIVDIKPYIASVDTA